MSWILQVFTFFLSFNCLSFGDIACVIECSHGLDNNVWGVIVLSLICPLQSLNPSASGFCLQRPVWSFDRVKEIFVFGGAS